MELLGWEDLGWRVGAALLMGAVVGLERERKHRPAGFRTMILVSLGSACFMIAGEEVVMQHNSSVPAADISRVLQGLIGGIGFLGAGAVIQSKKAVRGMTTAAAVWVVAALGAACGMGLYRLVLIGGLATLFTLVVLERFEEKFFPDAEDDAFVPKGKKNGNGNGHGQCRGAGPSSDPDTSDENRLTGESR